jgi:ribosomal protein L11 methyltransferase
VIELDPGMAFGTGTHETTALCAGWLEELVKPGIKAIDLGTGTGILAIAAALLGATDVLATDIDRVAVRIARENIKINHVDGVVRAKEADVLKGIGETADLVIANIIADVILMIAPAVFQHVNAGGDFLCSGISTNRGDEVERALKDAGFEEIRRRERGEWAAIAAKKPCAAS